MPETTEEDEKKDLGHGSPSEEVQKEEISPVKSPVRRGRKPKTETLEAKPKEAEDDSAEKKPRRSVGTPSVERPARERKAVERYAALSPRRVTPSKIPPIEQGPGTKLKDIPNVSFKLSKRKVDENLQALHTILFGRKANAHYLKRNISQFSGFVWANDEEKQKTKMKEKLDKCNKDRLLDFCELLDVCAVKGTTKKEEISVKLMEFLESPYVSRDVVLAEKEKAKKRKRRRKGLTETVSGEASSDGDDKTDEKKHPSQSAKSEKVDESASSEAKDEPADEHNSDSEDNQREADETQEDSALNEKRHKTGDSVKTKEKSSLAKKGRDKSSAKSSSKDRSKTSEEPKESAPKGVTPQPSKAAKKRKAAPDEDSVETPAESNDTDPPTTKPKVESKSKGRQKKIKKSEEQMAANAKRPDPHGSKSNASSKGKVKAKASSVEDGSPTKEELREVVSEILKEVDFSTATLADILRQLGDHFNKNLMDRKAEVKAIIEEVISNMSDDDEVDEGDDEEGPEDEDPVDEGSDGEDDG